jgi:hypothetical protein
MCWIKAEGVTLYQGLIGRAAYRQYLAINNSKFHWIIRDSTNANESDLSSTTTPVAGTWYHVAGTYDGTTQRLYVNGAQEASAAPGYNQGGGSGVAPYLGSFGASTHWLDGTMDSVVICATALDADEIEAAYLAGKGLAGSGGLWTWGSEEMSNSFAGDLDFLDISKCVLRPQNRPIRRFIIGADGFETGEDWMLMDD